VIFNSSLMFLFFLSAHHQGCKASNSRLSDRPWITVGNQHLLIFSLC